MENNLEGRVGRFEIPEDVIREQPEIALAVLSGIIVVRAEMMFHKKGVEYVGLSKHFDDVEALDAPTYDAEYDPDTGSVTWVRQEA